MEEKKWLMAEYIKSFFTANDVYNLLVKWIFYIISIVLIAIFLFNWYFMDKFSELKSWIDEIKTSAVLIAWTENYRWLDYQINYLNKFSAEQKKIVIIKWKELFEKINNALPDELNENYIATFFEELFLSLSQEWNEIVLNWINVSKWSNQTLDIGWKKFTYQKFTVSVSFSASEIKSEQLLDLIQVSWLLDEKYYYKWHPLPIMSTSSVNLNFKTNKKANKSNTLKFYMYSYNKI